MSCFYVSARPRVCSSLALSRLCALFCVGAWCSDPGTHVLSFGFVSGFGHCAPCSVSLCERAARVRSAARSLVHVCCVCVWFVFLSAACIHVMSCAVWHAACVFHWLRLLSCCRVLWNTRLMSILISCVFVSCFAHGW